MLSSAHRPDSARPSADSAYRLFVPVHDHQWSEFLRCNLAILRNMIHRSSVRFDCALSDGEFDEILQEIHVRLWMKRHRMLEFEPEQAWSYVRRMVENLISDRRRDEARWNRTLEEFAWSTSRDRHPLRPPPSTPEECLLAQERIEVFLATCHSLLQRGDRDLRIHAIRLALVEGHGSKEISHHLGGRLTATQVNSLLHRVRRICAEKGVHLAHRRRDTSTLRSPERAPAKLCRSRPKSSFDCV